MGTVQLLGQPERMLGRNLRWTSLPSRGGGGRVEGFSGRNPSYALAIVGEPIGEPFKYTVILLLRTFTEML